MKRPVERLGKRVAWCPISLEFNNDHVPVSIHPEEVDESPQIGRNLSTDDKDISIF